MNVVADRSTDHSFGYGRIGSVAEFALLVLLAGSWVGSSLGVRRQLDSLPPGSRALQLALYETADSLGPAIALGLAGIALLAVRRWQPMASFVGTSAIVLFLHFRYPLLVGAQATTVLMLMIASFWAALRTRRVVPLGVAALAVSALASWPLYGVNRNLTALGIGSVLPNLESFSSTTQSLVLTAAGLAAATLLRRSRELSLHLAHTNAELEEQREAAAQAAVAGERLRIARELHDVVAHHVTTMTVHAGAARQLVTTQPETVANALQHIEEGGRSAVNELHQLLGFLRGGDTTGSSDRSPTPSLRHLDRLVASFDSLDCTTTVHGDLDTIPASVDLSAYRIVQEALTNVVKHSTSPTAGLTIAVDDTVLRVEVIDHGEPTATGIGTGHGLLGMTERAALHGGAVAVGPSDGVGWRVGADLPLKGKTT